MRAGSNERGTCARRGASASCLVSARTVNLQGVMRRELRLDAGETAYAQVSPAVWLAKIQQAPSRWFTLQKAVQYSVSASAVIENSMQRRVIASPIAGLVPLSA